MDLKQDCPHCDALKGQICEESCEANGDFIKILKDALNSAERRQNMKFCIDCKWYKIQPPTMPRLFWKIANFMMAVPRFEEVCMNPTLARISMVTGEVMEWRRCRELRDRTECGPEGKSFK